MSQENNITPNVMYDPMIVKGHFIQTVQQGLNNLGPNEATQVRMKLIEILGQWNPFAIASPDMLTQVASTVFSDENLRDWLLSVKFMFIMNIAGGSARELVRALIDDMAVAMSIDISIDDFLNAEEQAVMTDALAMPSQLAQDLSTTSAARTVLAANPWLLVVMLLFAFMDLEHPLIKGEAPEPTKPPKMPL